MDKRVSEAIDHPIMLLAQKFSYQFTTSLKQGDSQYFMKDHYLITDTEPCFMCGMALVHSRILRLYFKESGGGAIEKVKMN